MGMSCWKQQLSYDPFGSRVPSIGSHDWDEAQLVKLNWAGLQSVNLLFTGSSERVQFSLAFFGSDAIGRQCRTLIIDICE